MFALFNEELRKAFESKIESEDEFGSSRIYKLALKAIESEDGYTYASDCLLKMGNNIDGMVGKANNVTVEANTVGDVATIATDGDANESQIRGLKPKRRVTYQ
ncbi:hypothetical protein SASPL_150562 [Salvia splendens]|uniref:Uncharacterized protein n=1 Tax=Salvia splendens TaxID=180675 RepID=A0A8X8W6Z0_SALSN|nr:hypothetical protein SASPL_150562 [Salvia splendens]